MASARQLPVDMYLLCLQDKHIVNSIWEGNERLICPRRHAIWIAKHVHEIDERIKNILQVARFIHILQASSMEINHQLVTALVERWRVETHTFHLPLGESTITLEDVALQLGLPIEGHVVIGISNGPLTVFCHQLLGDVPPENCVRGNRIKLSWLNNTFRQLPHDATEQVIEQYARAYMLIIIGSVMMLDTSASMVHLMYLPLLADLQNVSQYSWGSATLSCLYRVLDHGTRVDQENIGGCMILLQCWAWERITCLSPELLDVTEHDISFGAVFPLAKRWCRTKQSIFQDTTTVKQFRQKIYDLSPRQLVWTLYRHGEISQLIQVEVPPTCRAVVPLICFSVVEYQQSDRVMRQFGFRQNVPHPPMNLDEEHKQDMRGRADWNWHEHHHQWIALWNDRHNCVFNGIPFQKNGHLRDESEYMRWYITHTIRYIGIIEDSTDEEYDMDHDEQFHPTSQYRASSSYHDPQRSASDHVNYQHPPPNSRFQQNIPPTSTYPRVETSYFAFPPSTPFSGGPSNYFRTSTMTPPSSYPHASSSHNVYRPTYDFQNLQQCNESHPTDEDQHTQSPTLQQQSQRRGKRQRRRPPCGTGGHR
ncbi:hypothetical protein VIGAN_01230200 [Vigna angularis var. angularis]|uniref:Aminotransferase-like plant mobile domain-containing protein n=1 Tax=Vigna angularis var. angularis TaxID=157739 RepID=A0A0S3R260_PHAAN|nr:hypothetical protein VIGAN_01230200 [Vigna angularis var. angularis]